MRARIRIRSKWLTLLLIINVLGSLMGHAQNKKDLVYMAYVELMDTQNNPKGLLYEVLDSAVVLFVGKDPLSRAGPGAESKYITIPSKQIYRIKLRTKGKVARSAKKGALYGIVAGLALGGLEAVAYEADPWIDADVGELLLIGSLSGAMSGAMYGAIIGSFKTKIPINGNQQRFSYQKDFLRGHAFKMPDNVQSPQL